MNNSQPHISDIIIAKFIPIIGAIAMTTGLGYLIYTSVWDAVPVTMRLGLGFFASILLIGGGFSLTHKAKYVSDTIIGSGLLLFYGTLIYGSRTTEIAQAVLPEVATLVTALISTIAIAYFASMRKSKAILILGMAGAYLLPFVIGQSGRWELSFEAYLIYFAMINATIFLLGREISAKEIIPLNIAGLFFGSISVAAVSSLETVANPELSVILMGIIVILTAGSLVYSSKYLQYSNNDSLITFGYLMPFAWFLLHLTGFDNVNVFIKIFTYFAISAVYFGCWHYLRALPHIRYQHIGAYAGGVIALSYGISNIFGAEFNTFSSIAIAFIGLGFAIWNMLAEAKKGERILTAIILTAVGGLGGAMYGVFDFSFSAFERTFLISLALLPAIALFPLSKAQKNIPEDVTRYLFSHSTIAGIVVALLWIGYFSKQISPTFVFFILPGFLMILFGLFRNKENLNWNLATIGLIILSLGFFKGFFYFVAMLVPHQADATFLFTNGGLFDNPNGVNFLYAIFAIFGYGIFLHAHRKFLPETYSEKCFVPITIFYAIVLLVVNFLIVIICNDLGIEKTTGGIRAIGTTFWWIILSLVMIFMGIRGGKIFNTEKLLGLILLFLTLAKIGMYDLSAMDTDKKIIVLLVVGGFMMLFSYFLQTKGYLKNSSDNQ